MTANTHTIDCIANILNTPCHIRDVPSQTLTSRNRRDSTVDIATTLLHAYDSALNTMMAPYNMCDRTVNTTITPNHVICHSAFKTTMAPLNNMCDITLNVLTTRHHMCDKTTINKFCHHRHDIGIGYRPTVIHVLRQCRHV